MKYFVNIDGRDVDVDVRPRPGGGYLASVDGSEKQVQISEHSQSDVTLLIDGRVMDWVVSTPAPELSVAGGGQRMEARVESARARALEGMRHGGAKSDDGQVRSPMPGKVVKLLVAEGDEVAEGAPVVVVEAMKMENELTSPKAGTVSKIHVAEGDTVEGAAPLLTIA